MGNVAFESSDVNLDGWQSPPHDDDTILHMNYYPFLFHKLQHNEYILEINSPQGQQNNAYIDSHRMIPFQGDQEYYAELYVYPINGPFHWFYIYDSRRITIVIDHVQDGKPLVYYYDGQSSGFIGSLSFNQWNSVKIHANPGNGIDFQVTLNQGNRVNCQFNDEQSNGDSIRMGDDEIGQVGNQQNYGHCYFDNIRIYHTPQPSTTVNDYDLSEEFGMGKDYQNGGADARDFWTAQSNGNGNVQTVFNAILNVPSWRNNKNNIYINCPPYKKAWAETPHFSYNPQSWSYGAYWVSMWIYIDNPNCNFFHVIYNGHINLVIYKEIENTVKLNYVLTSADHPVCELNIHQWYKLNIKVTTQPQSGSPYYQIYINGNLIIPPGLSDSKIDLMYLNIVKDENDLTYLQMGIDTQSNVNHGEMYWDQIRFDQ
ncbi:MAG: hypothetical protein QW379_06920 [Thermoplasmata archaeon]